MNNRHIELEAENERFLALLARAYRFLPMGGTETDQIATDIRAALAATKDAVPTCVKCGEIEGAHDEQEVVQVGHVFIAATKG
jgi:hypothetical protein